MTLHDDLTLVHDSVAAKGGTVRAISTGKDGHIYVLAELPKSYQPFVTWTWDRYHKECIWGHYYSEAHLARLDFWNRVNGTL